MLNELIPNVFKYWDEFIISIYQTLEMMIKSGFYSIIFGLILGVVLVTTKPGGILQNKWINRLLDSIVNILRSIPFIILLTALIPLTRVLFGTSIGVKGIIFPLVVGCTPFFIRQVDLALSEVDPGLVEAAQAMGFSPFQIITSVYIKESVPALTRAITITLISLLGLTTLGGAIGSGGIGDYVIRYGHIKRNTDISIVAIIGILIFVSVIQGLGNFIIKKTTH